jgi:hypothetical protein
VLLSQVVSVTLIACGVTSLANCADVLGALFMVPE